MPPTLLRCPRTRLSASAALCALLLCCLYVYPLERPPSQQDIVRKVLQQQRLKPWTRDESSIRRYRELLQTCCDPMNTFAVTKENSHIGKILWYDGELYHFHKVNNETFSLFVQETPLRLPPKKCAVVGNGGVLKNSGCGRDIDRADFIMRCNLPPLSKGYTEDVGTRTHLVTANPSIIAKRFQNLLWSQRSFVESMKVYGSSYIYMPAFSMKSGTEPSLRVYHALAGCGSNQTVLFANPDFLKSLSKFWKDRGIRAKRLSTGLFLASLALGLCEEVTLYGFWPFSLGPKEDFVSHHYYDNVLPLSGFHAMPEEFLQLWQLHNNGTLRMRIGRCPRGSEGSEPPAERT